MMSRLFGGQDSLLVAQLLDALDVEGCPICHLMAEADRRELSALLHERVCDEGTREQLAQNRGLCAEHTRLLLQVGGRGCHAKIALLYGIQMASLADEIEALPPSGRVNGALETHCHVCANGRRTEELYTEMLARRVTEPRFRQAALSGGLALCLPHLQQVYALASRPERQFLREVQAARLRALSADLREFARKSAQASQATHEAFGSERDAWIRALRLYDGNLNG